MIQHLIYLLIGMNGKKFMDNTDLAAEVKSSQGNYRIVVGNSILEKIPSEIKNFTNTKNIFIIADKVLFPMQVLILVKFLKEMDIKPTH